MREKVTRLLSAFAFLLTIGAINISPALVSAAADTCTWKGSTSANWSDGSNWTGCDNSGVPENGDTLVFGPSGVGNKSMNNDIAGLTPANITVSTTGYTFNGNALTFVASGNAFVISATATVNLQVAFNAFNSGGSVSSGQTLTFNQPVAFGSAGGQYWTGGGDVFFMGTITGSAGTMFRAENSTSVNVYGASNTYTASFVGAESNALFNCSSLTCFGDAANQIYMGGGTVKISTTGTYSNHLVTSTPVADDSWFVARENITMSGGISVNDPLNIAQYGNGTKNLQFLGANINLNLSSISLYGSNSTDSTIRLDTGTQATGSVTVNTVSVIMTTSNNYDGLTTVKSGGILSVENSGGLGDPAAGTIIEDGGTLSLDSAFSQTIAEPISVAGTGAGGAGAIVAGGAGTHELSGPITLTGDTKIANLNGAADDFAITGALGGTGDLTLLSDASATNDPGISIDGLAANTYSGTTYAVGGAIYFDKTGAVPHNLVIQTVSSPNVTNGTVAYVYGTNAIADTATVTTHTSDDKVFFGNNTTPEVIGGLVGAAGELEIENNTTLIVDQNFDSVFAGTFYNDGSTSTFVKRGAGKLSLTGSDSFVSDNFTYNVEGGALAFNGDFLTASTVNVSAGAKLMGTGIIGSVSLLGGKLAPGNSPGTLHVSNLTLNSAATFEVEIAGPTAGTQYDQLISTGAVDLGNAVLSLVPTYIPAAGQVFTIITGTSITGTFNGLANGSTITANGVKFRVNYTATTVTLTSVTDTASLADTGTTITGITLSALSLIGAAFAVLRRKSLVTSIRE